MADSNENSINRESVIYEVASLYPFERLNELRYLLNDFQDNWEFLFVYLYPFEVKKLLNEFSHFEFVVFEDNKNSPTIFCRISRFLN